MKPCTNLLECIPRNIKKLRAAVAYVKLSGVEKLREIISKLDECVVITSLDFGITELAGLKELRKLGCNIYLYNDDNEFHPKVYVLGYSSKKIAVIGSSNLSEGAITGKNIEFNLLVEEEEIVREAESFINKLLSESILITDDFISQLEKSGYEKNRIAVQEKLGKAIFSLARKKDEYCQEFIKLYNEIQERKKTEKLLSLKNKIHEMAVNKVACDLASYGIDVEINEKNGTDSSDIIAYIGKSKVRIRIQGMILPNKNAIIHKLDFDYFIIVLLADPNNVEYFIIERKEIERLSKEGYIKYKGSGREYEKFGLLFRKIYKKYKSDLIDFIKRIIIEAEL